MKWKRITAGILAFSLLPYAGLSASAAASFSRFKHSWSILSNSYSIPNPASSIEALTEEDYAAMTAVLDNTELFAANYSISNSSSVNYGMSAISMLALYDLIPYEEYSSFEGTSVKGLYNMTRGEEGLTDEMLSMIFYYQMLQESTAMQQYISNQKLTMTDAERLQLLVEQTESGTPSLVSVDWSYMGLAYSVEYGSYEKNERTYDGKLLVYYPRFAPTGVDSEKVSIYFSTEDWSWFIPYGSKCPENDDSLQYVCGDVNIINSGGLHQGTDAVPDSDFVQTLECTIWNSDYYDSLNGCTISAVDLADGAFTLRGTAPEDSLQERNNYYYVESGAGLAIAHEGENRLSAEMRYENLSHYADANAVTQFVTHPSGYLELTGEDSDYTLQMVFDEGQYTGSWYTMKVSGTADKVSFRKTDAGYLLTANELSNIIVSASGRGTYASLVFSAEADSVLLYEIDSSTLGAAVDTDGDGSYETTIARTDDPSGGTFLMGRNNWLFSNSSWVFGNTYDFTESDRALLEANLSNIELYQAGELLNSEFLGSCYGMAALSLLSCHDLIDHSAYRVYDTADRSGAAVSLFDIGDITPETESLINYYAMLQYTEEVWQYIAWNMYSKTEAERLQELIDNMEAGIPTMVAYYGAFNSEGSRSGHAVVAYDIEYGEYPLYTAQIDSNGYYYTPSQPTHIMNGRILLYDNAAQDTPNTVSYLYFNTEDMSWYCGGVDSKLDGTLCMTASDPALLNAKGILDGTSYTSTEDFLALLFTNALESSYTVEKIAYDAGVWEAAVSTDAEIKAFPLFLASGESGKSQNFTMTDADCGYVLTAEQPEALELEMQYKDTLLVTQSESASQAVFHPEGYAEISGDSAPYTLEMVFNGGTYSGSWYDFKVSGTGSDVSMQRTEEGYILTADDLTDITAEAVGHTAQASLTFSAYTDSVLLYEEDESTIAVMADLDGDGVYETPAEDLPEPSLGDVNADGKADASDAAKILTAAAAAGSGAEDVLTAAQQLRADVNADGSCDASDAALVLQYAAAAGTGGTQTLEEFLAAMV